MFFLKENFIIYISTKRCNNFQVLNMKLNIWFDIPSKYIEDFCVIVSVAVGIFSKINWHILSGLFPLVFAISLAMVKTNVKNVSWKIFFQNLYAIFFFFFFFDLCYLPVTCYSWVLFLKQKFAHWVLSFWPVCVMLKSHMLMLL